MRALAEKVVTEALSWVGTPYRHQGRRKGVGCDCLGLVLGVWAAVCGGAPEAPGDYAPDWAEAGGRADPMLDAAKLHLTSKPLGEAAPGDVILFRWRPHLAVKHAGILVGAHAFAHAYEGHAVTVSPLVSQWRERIAGVFSFPFEQG